MKVSHVVICSMIKSGKELQERVLKYRATLGKDGAIIQETLDKRVKTLEAARDKINQDISDIWDDLYEVKSREDIHRWKQKTQFLPEYLSDATVRSVEKLNVETDEIISEGKIEDVLFYFDKLDANEKKECLEKIMAALKK